MPEVSAVIPIHNSEHFLRETLERVFGQICSEYETVCVGDAPQMGWFLFSSEYGDRVTIFQNVPAASIIAEKTGF